VSDGGAQSILLAVEVPGDGYHRKLISCQQACPVGTDARGYVRAIADGRFEEAYLIARGPNPFASICGRICGAPCEAACRRGKIPRTDEAGNHLGPDRPISIRALKRFACERFGPETSPPERVLEASRSFVSPDGSGPEEMASLLKASLRGGFEQAGGEPVAIIGAGPAGLAAAHDLALMGFHPIVYETESVAAGMLAFGVPDYRLPRELIRREVEVIQALGAEIRLGVTVGKDVSFGDLRNSHAAVVIAVGAKRPRSLGLPGERGPGVHGGVDFLRAAALGEAIDLGGDVVVIGGGNVAYDVARTVLRQAAYDAARTAARLSGTRRVRLVSLETLEEMPADTVEILEGDEEGIERVNGLGPVEIRRDDGGRVTGAVFRKCTRVYDESRRFAPIFDDSIRMVLDCDTVLFAAGQTTDLGFLSDGGADVSEGRPGWPKVDQETLGTTAPGIFVAGDLAHGTRLLIDAVASGKKAARSVYRHVTGKEIRPESVESHIPLEGYRRERGYESLRRVPLPVVGAAERLRSPAMIVERGYGEGEARLEASRCLDCGVTPVFDGSRCVLCGGCVDVCPTLCLKIVPLDAIEPTGPVDDAISAGLGEGASRASNSAILKDEDRCIRCALCVMRCPVQAIEMERIRFADSWRCVA